MDASQRLFAFPKVAAYAAPALESAVFAVPAGVCRVVSHLPIAAAVNLADASVAAAPFDVPAFAGAAALAGGPVVFAVPADVSQLAFRSPIAFAATVAQSVFDALFDLADEPVPGAFEFPGYRLMLVVPSEQPAAFLVLVSPRIEDFPVPLRTGIWLNLSIVQLARCVSQDFLPWRLVSRGSRYFSVSSPCWIQPAFGRLLTVPERRRVSEIPLDPADSEFCSNLP